ncbi:MAG: hypothetical protein IJQ16_10055 [Selenomonadaceae bacterium]|nr:hypothetical protein [Selenomonadaceae bacterium]
MKDVGVWNINAATDLISSMAQSTLITDSNSVNNLAAGNVTDDSSDYARILAEKIAEVNGGNNDQQNNSATQQENKSSTGESSESMPAIETLRRIMPDGSLRIVTYQDGEIVDQLRIRPHLVMEPDYSAPPDPNGDAALKGEQRLSLAQLLMA